MERLTPYTVPDERALLRKLARMDRGGPVHEWQQYTPGTVCAAVLAGALRHRIETTLTSLSFSVRPAPRRARER